MKKITKIVFALMFLIVLSDQTPAQIEVSGTIINGNWLEANSPYIVVGDIFVASLTIEPGVMIKFNGPYVFEVAGTLVAAGNEQNPIIFTTNNPELFWQGIYINAAQSTLLNYCRIEWSQNSGIRIKSSSPVINFCRLIYNFAVSEGMPGSGGKGSAIHVESGSNVLINNCVLDSNLVLSASYYNRGGAIYCSGDNADIYVRNCIIAHNEISTYPGHSDGAGIYAENGGVAIVENCVITDTYVDAPGVVNGGGVFIGYPSYVGIVNSIIFGNGEKSFAFDFAADSSQLEVYYSCIDYGYPEESIISNNPLFADEKYNLLDQISPCIDRGAPDTTYNDPEDQGNPGYAVSPALGSIRNDMGAYGGPNSAQLPYIVSPITSVQSVKDFQPLEFVLSQNYPNPFNSKTVISWQVGATGQVDLTVYNLLGQKVATLVSEMQPAGYHQLEWDAAHLPSGVYYYLIKAGEYQDVKKMILLK